MRLIGVRFCFMNCLSNVVIEGLLFAIVIGSTTVTPVYIYVINEDNL